MTDEQWGRWAEELRGRLAQSIPMNLDDLVGKSNHGRDHVAAYRRRVAVYVLYRLQLGRDDIGELLDMHPVSVSKAAREIADRIKTSADFRAYVDEIVGRMEQSGDQSRA